MTAKGPTTSGSPETGSPETGSPVTEAADALLDALFAEARGQDMPASPDFLARVMGDAYAMQAPVAAVPVSVVPVGAPVEARGLVVRFWGWVSGFGAAAAGLATAGLAGFWIGFVQPAPIVDPVASMSDALQGGETVDLVELIPSLEGWLTEG